MFKANIKVLIIACMLVLTFALFSSAIEAFDPIYEFNGSDGPGGVALDNVGAGEDSIGSELDPVGEIVISAKNGSVLTLSSDVKSIYSNTNVFTIEDSQLTIGDGLVINNRLSVAEFSSIIAQTSAASKKSKITLGNNVVIGLISTTENFGGRHTILHANAESGGKAEIAVGNGIKLSIDHDHTSFSLINNSFISAIADNGGTASVIIGDNANLSTPIADSTGSAGYYFGIVASTHINANGNPSAEIQVGENLVISLGLKTTNNNGEEILHKIDGSNGVRASSNNTGTSTIVIGNNAQISVVGAAVEGIRSVTISGVSTLKLLNNAKIDVTGESAFGAKSQINTSGEGESSIEIGTKAVITVTGDSSYGVSSKIADGSSTYDGASGTSSVKIAEGAKITVTGNTSYGIYSSVDDDSDDYDSDDISPTGKSIIEIGANSIIYVAGNSSYGVSSSVGINSSEIVATEGKSEITLGDNVNISVNGTDSYVLRLGHSPGVVFSGRAILDAVGEGSGVFYFDDQESDASASFRFTNIIASSKDSNAIYNNGKNDISVSFAGSVISGDIDSKTKKLNVEFNDLSTWIGSSTSDLSFVTLVNSTWLINKTSSVENLKMTGTSTIQFEDSGYYSATVSSLDAQNGGVVKMKALAGNISGDTIIISSGSGSLDIEIYQASGTAEKSQTIVEAPNNFNISAPAEVGVGSRVYTWENEDSEPDMTSYYLQRTGDPNPVVTNISAGSIGMIQSAKALDDIITFDGVKKTHGFFIHGHYKHQTFSELDFTFNDKSLNTIPFKQNIWGGIIGYNWGINENVLLGAFLGITSTKQTFEDTSNSNIQILTGGIQTMVDIKSFDVHVYVRLGHNKQALELLTPQKTYVYGNTSALGIGVSASLSYPIEIEKIQLTITPIGRIFFSHIGEHDFYVYNSYASDPEMKLVLSAESGFQTWLGANVTKTFTLANGMNLNAHASIGWVFNEGDSVAIVIDDDSFMASVDRHLFSMNLGADLDIRSSYINSVFLDLNFMLGKSMKEVFGIKIGGSWEF